MTDYIAEPALDYGIEVYIAIVLFLVAVLVAVYLIERFAPPSRIREVEVGDRTVKVNEDLIAERMVGYQ